MKRALLAVFSSLGFAAGVLAGENPGVVKCAVSELHPTQISVGMTEVKVKEHKLKKMDKDELKKFKRENPEPSVLGPGGKYYIVDHHHLARALFESGVDSTWCNVIADYSGYSMSDFWNKMSERNWVYPYDENGHGPMSYSAIPARVEDLKDDPYRSLAGFVRKAGGYDKSQTPFTEFKWADFFRARISGRDIEDDFDACVEKGVKLAHSPEAAGLPGYQGK